MMIGLHIMRPSSIAVAGGGTETASIRSDGGVDFANATSLSLNGVFTADYDNYMISIKDTDSSNEAVGYRMRLSGTDATGTNYTYQSLLAASTTVSAARTTSASFGVFCNTFTDIDGGVLYLYGPDLAQPTASRSVNAWSDSGARFADYASTHSLSTAYDGITFIRLVSGTLSGMITVYGYAQ